MFDKLMPIFRNDIQEYKSNFFQKKINRGIFLAFLLLTLIPRGGQGFIHFLSNSSDSLLTTSQLPSLAMILAFNTILLFSYLIQAKILPLAYNSNYIPSIFDSLSFSISRSLFFIITNWFILAWILTGLLLSSTDINLIIILKFIFVTLNITTTLSLIHEKKYVVLPILLVQLVIYAYLSSVIFISVLNILLLLFVQSKIYDIQISTNRIKFFHYLKNITDQKILNNFICGHQSLRIGIMLRGNLLASVSIGCILVLFYSLFYHSLLSSKEDVTRILYLYTLSVLYLLSSVYTKLKFERDKFCCFLTSISSRSTAIIHDFIFTLITFELIQILSLYFFPVAFEWSYFVPLTLLSIPVLAVFCFLSTINSYYRKISLFVAASLIVWIILWNF